MCSFLQQTLSFSLILKSLLLRKSFGNISRDLLVLSSEKSPFTLKAFIFRHVAAKVVSLGSSELS